MRKIVKRKFLFTESERERVQEAVRLAESGTTGEIVPWIVDSCKGYRWVHGLLTIAGIVLATIALGLAHRDHPWDVHLADTVLWQALGALGGLLLSKVPTVKRSIIPAAWMEEEVHQRALAAFVSGKLTDTADRNGVLIFIALFERRVEILADRGIDRKAPKRYWDDRVAEIIEGVHQGTPVDALCHAVYLTGVLLTEHFPRHTEDTNELSDELREN